MYVYSFCCLFVSICRPSWFSFSSPGIQKGFRKAVWPKMLLSWSINDSLLWLVLIIIMICIHIQYPLIPELRNEAALKMDGWNIITGIVFSWNNSISFLILSRLPTLPTGCHCFSTTWRSCEALAKRVRWASPPWNVVFQNQTPCSSEWLNCVHYMSLETKLLALCRYMANVHVDSSSYTCISVAIIGLSSRWLAHFISLCHLRISLLFTAIRIYTISIECFSLWGVHAAHMRLLFIIIG